MSEVFGSIWWLLVTLGLLITFHEFGHFWVARRLGVRVLRFSVGFGKPIWSRRGADGTVNAANLNALAVNWGKGIPMAAHAVPEPSSLVAFLAVSVWLLPLLRRR